MQVLLAEAVWQVLLQLVAAEGDCAVKHAAWLQICHLQSAKVPLLGDQREDNMQLAAVNCAQMW